MNPAPNHNHHEPTEDGSEICGNTMPDFRDYEDLNRNSRPRQIRKRSLTEGVGSSTPYLDTFYPTFRQQEPRRYEDHARSLFNTDVDTELSKESTQLFPKSRNSGKFHYWLSRIIGNSHWTGNRAWRTLSWGGTECTLWVLQRMSVCIT
jgi:hypothetical protein